MFAQNKLGVINFLLIKAKRFFVCIFVANVSNKQKQVGLRSEKFDFLKILIKGFTQNSIN